MPAPMPFLLMTRPKAEAQKFTAQLAQHDDRFQPIYAPLIGITHSGPLPDMTDVAGLLFTSANGVAAYMALGGRRDLPAFTVGSATAQAAQDAGLQAHSADGTVEDLLAQLIKSQPTCPLLHLRGVHSRGDLANRLTAAELTTRSAVIYDQPELALTAQALTVLTGRTPVVVPLFSPRTAALLAKTPVQAPLLVAAMSEAVANAVAPLHTHTVKVAKHPDAAEMQVLTQALLAMARTLEAQGPGM